MGEARLALEIAPFSQNITENMTKLKQTNVDMLMMPLDCFSPEAQKKWLPEKASLLGETYWKNAADAVTIFGEGRVSSSIIVGLEPLPMTFQAIEKMLSLGVVPEAIPLRWYDQKLEKKAEGTRLPLTNPGDLFEVYKFINQKDISNIQGKVRAGCAQCGGCGTSVLRTMSK